MELSHDIERILREYDDKFISTNTEHGLPTYTQHPDVLRNWIASKLAYYDMLLKDKHA